MTIKADFLAGTDIASAFRQAIELSKIVRCNIEFYHNGVTCIASLFGNAEEGERQWLEASRPNSDVSIAFDVLKINGKPITYEILSFKGLRHNNIIPIINGKNTFGYTVENYLFNKTDSIKDGRFEIYSVKRLSDGEVFTIGDLDINGYKITSFKIKDEWGSIIAYFDDSSHCAILDCLLKPKKEKLTYEILSLKGIGGSIIYKSDYSYPECFQALVNDKIAFQINSVKRLSDNQVFKIGDKNKHGKVITSFELAREWEGGLAIHFDRTNATESLAFISKPRRETCEVKPPLGIKPQWLHNEERYTELTIAIERYNELSREVPQKWVDEKHELFVWIQNYYHQKK